MSRKEEYQKNCSDEVIKRIVRGKRRLTLFMPAGMGKTDVALQIIKRIGVGQTILMVYDMQVLVDNFLSKNTDEVADVRAVTVDEMVEEKIQADVLFLMDLRAYSRLLVSRYLGKGNSALVVSFTSTPPMKPSPVSPVVDYVVTFGEGNQRFVEKQEKSEDSEQGQISRLLYYLNMPLIIETEDVLDPRDIVTADEEEKNQVYNQVKDEIELAKNCEAILPQDDSHKDELNLLKRRLSYMEMIAEVCGVSVQKLNDGFAVVEAERKAMETELNSSDETVREKAIAVFAKRVSDHVVFMLKDTLPKLSHERNVEILKAQLSEDVWERKLSEEAKSCLVSARSTFEVMCSSEGRDGVDYSGVCLLVTKSVDIEVSRRLFSKYVSYLERRFPICSQAERWPRSLLTEDRTAVIPEKDFTLGTIPFVVGIDKTGTVKNNYVYRLFMEYARDELYERTMTEEERTRRVVALVESVEKIRTDFRNPSAHRDGISFVTAKECMDYTLETYRKLREILELMRE